MSGAGKAEAADVVVLAQRGELKTLSDVVALLKTAWAKEGGIPAEVFHNNGIASINVAATALRARGYEIEVFGDRGGAANASPGGPCGRGEETGEGSNLTLRFWRRLVQGRGVR